MADNTENPRPTKRSRTGSALPDGFAITPKPKSDVKHKAPKFISGFVNAHASSSSGSGRDTELRPLQRPDFGAVAPKPAARLQVLKPPALDRLATTLAGPSDSKPKPTDSDTRKKGKVSAVTSLRHIIPPPVQDQYTQSPRNEDERHRTVNDMLHNPPKIRDSFNSSLKPMPIPPPRPFADRGPLPLSSTKLKTITTTRFAKATDPRTESGSVELLSMFLKQHGAEFVDPVERELRRGVERTPEKNKDGKGKGKFVRGGLAESFSRRFSQSNTDQKLWEEQVTRSFADGKRIKTDLRLKILAVLHRSPGHSPNKPHAPCITLVKCLVTDSQVSEIKKGEATMLFRHSSHGMGQREFQIEVEDEVYVWRPWHTLQTFSSEDDSSNTSDAPVSSTGEVWMCTRFYVPQERPTGIGPSIV